MTVVPAIANTDRILDATATASQTDFNIAWPVIADSEAAAADDLIVLVDGVTVDDANFSFAGNAITDLAGMWNGGIVSLSTPCTAGQRVIIYSDRSPRRTGSFLEGKSLPFTTLDELMDDFAVQLRDIDLRARRSLTLSPADYLDGVNPEDVSGQVEIAVQAAVAAEAGAVAAAAAAGSDLWSRPVISILAAPPGGPATGDRYLVAHSGTSGVFIGHEDQAAEWRASAWLFSGAPGIGQRVVVQTDNLARRWSAGAWLTDSATVESYTYGAGARARNINSKLGEWVSALDYGNNSVPGTTDMTSAVQAAINTVAPTIVIPDVCLISSKVVMANPYQKLAGVGLKSELRFTFAAPDIGIEITNATGRHWIEGLLLNGTANISKLVSVKAPQVTLKDSRFVNASGHVIYAEDENIGSNIFAFGLGLVDSFVYGDLTSGHYGVRLGLNSQTSRLIGNVLEHCGRLLQIEGATANLPILANIFEGSVDSAINLSFSATPLMSNVSIHSNYFEENQVCIIAGNAEFQALSIKNNSASRNTASKTNSYFYKADGPASAASSNIVIDYNRIEDFDVGFGLADEYASKLISCKGNNAVSLTSYSSGTFANNVYDLKTFNNYYSRRLTAGAFLSETNLRLEAKSASFEQPIAWGWREYLDRITFNYVQNSGTGVTVELHKVMSEGVTDTIIGTVTANTDGIKTIAVGAYADPAANYYLKATYDNTGSSSYVYPFRLFFRQ